MDENYVKSIELWIATQKVQIEQKKESLATNIKQMELLSQENNLLSQQIQIDTAWTSKTEGELNQYKKDNQ